MNGLGISETPNNQATTQPRTDSPKPGGQIGKDEFLQLLVTQLSNQDPMNPMDGQQFAAQLAQFTSVEQLVNINEMLSQSAEMNGMLAQSINSGVAAGLIGKSVQAGGNVATWDGQNPTQLHFELADPATNVSVTIRDQAGNAVRTIDMGQLAGGKHSVEWDGTTGYGASTSPGSYSFEVKATNAGDDDVNVQTFTRGTVERISFGQDGIQLWFGSHSIPMSAVESVE